MGDRVLTDPAFVDRFVRALVARVGGEADALGGVVDTAVDGVHAEGEQVTGAELRGEPASPELLPEGARIIGELAAVLPPVVTRDIGAARIDVRLEIVFDAVRLKVGFFQDHETADFQRHLAVGDPGGVEAVCSASHVDDVAMRGSPVTASHGTEPDIVEMPDRSPEEAGVELLHFGAEDHAVERWLVFPGRVVEFRVDSLFEDPVGKWFARLEDLPRLERVQQRHAGFQNDVPGEEAPDVEVAVLLHAFAERLGVVPDRRGVLEPAEGMLVGFEFVTDRGDGAFDGCGMQCCLHGKPIVGTALFWNGSFGKRHVFFGK